MVAFREGKQSRQASRRAPPSTGVKLMSTAPHQKSDEGIPAAVRSGPDTRTSRAPSAPIEWPVGVVADWLGIPASTLRTWERRYGLGPSERTRGGHRRYTEQASPACRRCSV